ncbi:MAG: L,D-transpeptidase family protein [Hyphomonadaceae bacterium]
MISRALAWTLLFACIGCTPTQTQLPPAPEVQTPARSWTAEALADLILVADAAPDHGFAHEHDTIAELRRLDAASDSDAGAAAALDARASALFRKLARQFAQGAVDPRADPAWHIPPTPAAMLEPPAHGVADTLFALLPADAEYRALTMEHARLRDLGDLDPTRAAHLRASMERRRWLPRELPARRIEVIVPFFELHLRDGEGVRTRRRVIIGARTTPTPSFASALEAITFNPSWTPPLSIALGELAPRFQRDPGAAAADGFDILDRNGGAVDPNAVDWAARPFPYSIRQRPGPNNALGSVRFELSNPFAIYMHDTPGRRLFDRTDRALSHGCIRVQRPEELAVEVLADPGWDRAAVEAAIARGATRTVQLPEHLPVYILYLTASTDEAGAVIYADDLYGRDAALLQALENADAPITAERNTAETDCASAIP